MPLSDDMAKQLRSACIASLSNPANQEKAARAFHCPIRTIQEQVRKPLWSLKLAVDMAEVLGLRVRMRVQ